MEFMGTQISGLRGRDSVRVVAHLGLTPSISD